MKSRGWNWLTPNFGPFCDDCWKEVAALATQQAAIRALRELVYRVVTGDGAQLENLDMTDEQWRGAAFDMFGPDCAEHFEVTMRLDDWLALVHAAKLLDAEPGETK